MTKSVRPRLEVARGETYYDSTVDRKPDVPIRADGAVEDGNNGDEDFGDNDGDHHLPD